MTITNSQLAELRRLEQSATAGPWKFVPGGYADKGGHVLTASSDDEPWTNRVLIIAHYFYDKDDADYSLIAAARNHLAPLLDEVERLRAALREAVDAGHAIVWDSSNPTALDALARLAKLADGTP